MQYTIISIHNKKYKEHSKEALFKIVDDFGLNKFVNYFKEYFFMSSTEGSFIYKEYKSKKYDNYENVFIEEDKKIYSNAYYIILGEDGYPINLNNFLSDYKQSRKIIDKSYGWKQKNRGTQKYRNRCKKENKRSSGIIQEYINLLETKEYGVKVRSKRLNLMFSIYIAGRYEDYQGRMYVDNKTWKNNKVKKQWLKKAS